MHSGEYEISALFQAIRRLGINYLKFQDNAYVTDLA